MYNAKIPLIRRFYTIPEEAEQLNIGLPQVRSLLKNGDLEGIQIGGRNQWRIEEAKLDEYIERLYEAQRQERE